MSESQPPPPPPTLCDASSLMRDYRKGNWTVQETLTLITAKRHDDERRSIIKPPISSSPTTSASASPVGSTTVPRSAEQRWKWVENYCWRNGCLRSQNQCNDKWDNLLRDYKKVRDYETKLNTITVTNTTQNHESPRPVTSYWALERHQRKERNLPTNLSPEVFEALTDVLTRRNARRNSAATPVAALPPPPPPPPLLTSLPPMLTPPPPPMQQPQPSVSVEVSETGEESESDEPDAKRRKVRSSNSGVVRGASILAQTLMACEEKREHRHRELIELEERRLKLEEERTEMNRQAVSGLISAVSGLSNAIHAIVSSQHHGSHDETVNRSQI